MNSVHQGHFFLAITVFYGVGVGRSIVRFFQRLTLYLLSECVQSVILWGQTDVLGEE